MLNLAAEGIGVIMCGILSVTPVTPIPVNPHSINALEIKKETVIHQNEIRENSQADPIEIKILENTNAEELAVFQHLLESLPKEAKDLFANEKLQKQFLQICRDYEIDPYLMLALMKKESAFIPTVSNGKCIGLCQINEHCHKNRMEKLDCDNLYDPYQNMLVAADYLAELLNSKRDTTEALMYYNMTAETAKKRYEAGEYSSYAIDIQKEAIQLREIAEEKPE